MSTNEETSIENNEQPTVNGDAEETPKGEQPPVVDNESKEPTSAEETHHEEPGQTQNGDSNAEPTQREQKDNDQQQNEGDIQPQADEATGDGEDEKGAVGQTPEKSKEDKKAEEQKKKEEKQKERELEKERKQKEKEAKEEQKKRAKEEKNLKKRRKKEAEVEVALLDGSKKEFVVPRKCKATAIFEEVYKHLDVVERDYFGLYYLDNMVKVYIDPLKTAKRQIPVEEDGSWKLHFGVKYYIEDPTILKEDITRYQYVLQICQDIKTQRIKVTKEQTDELMSLVLQSSVGDYNEEEHPAGYTQEFQNYFYSKKETVPQNLEDTIKELHKTKNGMDPEQCELEFLKLAQALPRYGVHTYSAQDTRGSQAILGISFRGVSLFQEAKEVHKFDWSDIVRVGFSKKKFKIWFDASVQNPESVKPVLLELHLHNQAAAKRLWVVCAEQHTFFRRSAPVTVPKAAGFFSFKRGSKFRYSGRTLKQMKETTAREEQPEFKRTYSERYSKPAKKKIRKTASLENVGTVGTSTVVTAEVPPEDKRPDSALNDEETAVVVRTFLKNEQEKAAEEEPITEPADPEPPKNEEEQQPSQEPQEQPQEPQEETVEVVEEQQTESQPPPQEEEQQPQEEPPVDNDQPPADQGDEDHEVVEEKIELGDPEGDEVEDDAKALVNDVLEDATKKVSDED
jgi:hypothetical protein